MNRDLRILLLGSLIGALLLASAGLGPLVDAARLSAAPVATPAHQESETAAEGQSPVTTVVINGVPVPCVNYGDGRCNLQITPYDESMVPAQDAASPESPDEQPRFGGISTGEFPVYGAPKRFTNTVTHESPVGWSAVGGAGDVTLRRLATGALARTEVIPANANYGAVSMGSGPFDGSTAGFFAGSASGTGLAINAASGFGGNLVDLQLAGAARYVITNAGQVQAADGLISAPAYSFKLDTSTGIWRGGGGQLLLATSGVNRLFLTTNTATVPSTSVIGWSSSTADNGHAVDVGLARNAIGVGEINNGTAGTFRDLKLRKLLVNTGSNMTAGTGTLSSGTATISTTQVTASSLIFLTDTSTGTNLGILSAPPSSIVAGTSFVVNSSLVTDSGTFNWWLIN